MFTQCLLNRFWVTSIQKISEIPVLHIVFTYSFLLSFSSSFFFFSSFLFLFCKVSSRDKWKEAQRTAVCAQSRLYAGIVDIDDKQIVAEKEIAERERGWFSRMSKRYKEYIYIFFFMASI